MKTIGFLVTLSIIVFEVHGATYPSMKKPIPEIVIECKHGNGMGQIGFNKAIPEESIPSEGPRAFDIDEQGNIYVLDSVNLRIVKFSQSGEWVKAFPIKCGMAKDMVVVKNKAFVINVGAYDNVEQIDLISGDRSELRPLTLINPKTSHFEFDQGSSFVTGIQKKAENEIELEYTFIKVFVVYNLAMKSALIEDWNSHSSEKKSNCKTDNGDLVYFQYIDDRNRGYTWIRFQAHRISMYTQDCEQSIIYLKEGNEINMPKEVQILSDGTIYQMCVNENEPFQILKYRPVE